MKNFEKPKLPKNKSTPFQAPTKARGKCLICDTTCEHKSNCYINFEIL